MDASLEIAYKNIVSEKDFILNLKTYFIDRLKEEVSGIEFNGCSDDFSKSTYTLVNVCLPVAKEKAPLFLFQLDLKGIACSKGSACQSGSTTGSHVLNEVLSEENLKKPSIRFSFSCFNTTKEIDTVVHTLKALVLESAKSVC
jgi:cysteine desulfurase